MTVICPSCEAQFRDPPEEVLKTRTLQCSKCEHEWRVGEEKPRITIDAPSLAPEMSDLEDESDAIRTKLPVVMAKPKKPAPIFVDRAPDTQAPTRRGLVVPSIVLSCLMLAAAGVGLRSNVMQHFPQTAALYQAIGLATHTPGLHIANITTTKVEKDGIRQLIVRGEIENIANNTVPVPPVKLIMRGQERANLFAWTVSANKSELKAGEKGRFTAVAHDFPTETVNVDIEFVPLKVLDKASSIDQE